jgi:hypothetical protein
VVAPVATISLSPEPDTRKDAITSDSAGVTGAAAALLALGADTSDGRSSPTTEDAAVAIKWSNCDDRLCSSLVSNWVCSVPPKSK